MTAWTYEGSHIISNLVQIGLWLFKWGHFHIWTYLTTWPQMTFDLSIWPSTAWTYEGSCIVSINQVLFQSNFNFSNEITFTFSACLTTWPQMTFDLDMWPLTSLTYEGSHVASIIQLWLKSIKACGLWKLEPNVNLFSQQTTTTSTEQTTTTTVEWSLCPAVCLSC